MSNNNNIQGNQRPGPRDENDTNIFRPYSRPNSFRGVQMCSYNDSEYSTSDTVSISEYLNHIFMMPISIGYD